MVGFIIDCMEVAIAVFYVVILQFYVHPFPVCLPRDDVVRLGLKVGIASAILVFPCIDDGG